MFILENFQKKRLTPANVKEYLQKNYLFGEEITEVKRKHISTPIFLQNNYGKDGDCTLTSILTLTKFYNKSVEDNEIYNFIEKIAQVFFYNGDTYGTIPIFNGAIIRETFKHFHIDHKIQTKYFKGVGFNLNKIINLLDNNTPIMISIFKDGRKYYDGHTVTIVGYVIYQDEKHNQSTMLLVHDNWFNSYSFLDYEALRGICSICY